MVRQNSLSRKSTGPNLCVANVRDARTGSVRLIARHVIVRALNVPRSERNLRTFYHTTIHQFKQ